MVKFLNKMNRCEDAVAMIEAFEFPQELKMQDFQVKIISDVFNKYEQNDSRSLANAVNCLKASGG